MNYRDATKKNWKTVLLQEAVRKPIANWAETKKGDLIVVTDNTNGHNYPIGQVLTVGRNIINCTTASDVCKEFRGNDLRCSDVVVLVEEESLATLQYKLADHKAEIKAIESKINACKELEMKTYNPYVVRLYQALIATGKIKNDRDRSAAVIKLLQEEEEEDH